MIAVSKRLEDVRSNQFADYPSHNSWSVHPRLFLLIQNGKACDELRKLAFGIQVNLSNTLPENQILLVKDGTPVGTIDLEMPAFREVSVTSPEFTSMIASTT